MVDKWVKELTEEVFGQSSMRIGATIRHPKGYLVKVIDGQYWGTYGVSNFWSWRRVKPDGSLGKLVQGYGW